MMDFWNLCPPTTTAERAAIKKAFDDIQIATGFSSGSWYEFVHFCLEDRIKKRAAAALAGLGMVIMISEVEE